MEHWPCPRSSCWPCWGMTFAVAGCRRGAALCSPQPPRRHHHHRRRRCCCALLSPDPHPPRAHRAATRTRASATASSGGRTRGVRGPAGTRACCQAGGGEGGKRAAAPPLPPTPTQRFSHLGSTLAAGGVQARTGRRERWPCSAPGAGHSHNRGVDGRVGVSHYVAAVAVARVGADDGARRRRARLARGARCGEPPVYLPVQLAACSDAAAGASRGDGRSCAGGRRGERRAPLAEVGHISAARARAATHDQTHTSSPRAKRGARRGAWC